MADHWKLQLKQLHADLVLRDNPVELVTETDAASASYRFPNVAFRGPLFGLAAQDPAVGPEWRVVAAVVDGAPQTVRDDFNSTLWFRARDDTDDPAVRRELLAAVAVLEREPVDELEVLGVRYRVVRADEFARTGEDGMEPPRPTDREPAVPSWKHEGARTVDVGHVLSPAMKGIGPMAGALKLGLRDFSYAGDQFPDEVRADSEAAVSTHPGIAMLPVGFRVTERGTRGWRPVGALSATPHDARRGLYEGMTLAWPLLYGFDEETKAEHLRAAEEFKAKGRANELSVGGSVYRVSRVERLVRMGPDGPEPPRPSDVDEYGPVKIHPRMDEDGTVHRDE
ncbi:DUF5954 family protein [Streptomyces sp. NPDC050504]|uniref:DUF5954 family protein n=1 Tax=Streptomyces sp. NPDC050504 TaxID=3365618 RepID=UPI0037A356B7